MRRCDVSQVAGRMATRSYWRGLARDCVLVLAAACGSHSGAASDTVATPPHSIPPVKAIAPETIPAQPYTWTLGAIDTVMRRRFPHAVRRSPAEGPSASYLVGIPSVEYAVTGGSISAYLLGDQIAASAAEAELRASRAEKSHTFRSNNLLVVVRPPQSHFADSLEQLLTSHDARSARARRSPEP